MQPRETLQQVFGFEDFRPGQEAAIEHLLAGHSVLAIFPTGSGKSLCYQLPALLLEGVTLVVSPLIALMKDQIDFLKAHRIAAARLDSSVSLGERRQTEAELEAGRLKLLYVAPERFANERFLHRLRRLRISLLVIDEAHCISEWGHNFRPDYLKLAGFSRALGAERVLALTATATPAVADDICRQFAIAPEARIHTGFHRPNLILRITACEARERIALLIERLGSRPRGATIVYVTLQRTAEEIAAALAGAGLPARAYHAGMESADREAVQDWFMQAGDALVVATIAFGMGIDKADIRYVYHCNLPKSLENYAQEIGRAGRDGAEATCELLACGEDVTVLENFTFGDTPDRAAVGAMVEAILRQGGEFDLSTYELSRQYDLKPLVVGTLLTYLELEEVIEATAPFYSEYQFQPLKPSKEILARFDPERAAFLRKVFACATKALKWFTLDLPSTMQRLQTTRERLVKALTYLEEHGDLLLKVAGLRQGYRRKPTPADPGELAEKLAGRFETRERNDIARVQQVVALAEEQGCLVRHLLAHFGEELGHACGHCGPCLGAGEGPVSLARRGAPPALDRAQLSALRQAHPQALGSPRQLTRFLCGLTSPRLSSTKLTRHPLFGSAGMAPFAEVLQAVTEKVG